MFKRLLLDDWTCVITLTAFVTAVTIYACFAWRALRMRGPQLDHLARLPLADDDAQPAADRHDEK